MNKTPRITELCVVTWRMWLDDLCAPPRDPYYDERIGDRRFAKDARHYIGELERELAKLRQKLMRYEHAEAADILHPPPEETK